MLKKLYAHEYRSLFRSLLPIYIGLLCLALIGRMLYLFDSDSFLYNLVTGASAFFYVLGIIALFVVGAVIIVTRFYKNLLGGEGYLTFTLPFTPTQHIVCKLLCAVSVMIVDLLVVLASLLILGAGSEVMRDIFDLIKEFFRFYKAGEIAGVAAEIVLYIILSFFQGILMFYAAMAIGQQFKSRIGGAVLAYIGIYVGTEIIRNIVSMILIFGFSEKWETFFDDSFTAIRTIILLPIVWAVVLSIGCFIATRYFLTKRLNLE